MKPLISGLEVAVDASRNRSGGAVSHLKSLLRHTNPSSFGIEKIHVWSYKRLLEEIPNREWLIKHESKYLEKSIIYQLYWQKFLFPIELSKSGCAIVLNTDAGTVSRFSPSVTMSRDMLSYEPGEMDRYGFGFARMRLVALRYVQNRSLSKADAAIFLTRYAAEVIQQFTGPLANFACIPHGVGDNFKGVQSRLWPRDDSAAIVCLYVSNADYYKHQWKVIRAIRILRDSGVNIELTLVGVGKGPAQILIDEELSESDPNREFVTQISFVPHEELPAYFRAADLFIFASSCENMPNTLIEAMAAGLPIASSDRGPMPEILQDGGVYFDPEISASIAAAVQRIISDEDLRQCISTRAKALAAEFSWQRCAHETWTFLTKTLSSHRKDF